MFINYNSKLIPKDQVILSSENRAFRYGDGIFESIRIFDGQIIFWNEHWKRLSKGAEYLQFEKLKDASFYKEEIEKLCGNTGNWRIRLSLFRKDGGLYTPAEMKTDFIIEASPLESKHFILNKKGLTVDLCDTIKIPQHPLSNFKTNNSLPYVLAGIFKKKKGLDDCILLNNKGHVVEGSSSNIFIVKKGKLITPKLSSGCKMGTMRSAILRLSEQIDLKVCKQKILPKDLKKAEEIWLTNATQGIRWIGNYDDKNYQKKFAKKMTNILNQAIPK